jgi:chemotaxis protein MotB
MSQGKKHEPPHEDHADEGWLLPYSDMMTLLLALFIVMFAISSVDQTKYNAMMESMYKAFGGTVDEGEPITLPYIEAGLPGLEEAPGLIHDNISNLYTSLNSYIASNGLEDAIDAQYLGTDILVTLKNDVFFQSASADLSPEMASQAHILAQLLEENQSPENPFDVIVAGHTDNVPIRNARFPSNWHLSAHRALNFLTTLLEDTNLDPTHFSSRGYGEYAPVASNETSEGRQKNRRVELLVSQPGAVATEEEAAPQAPVAGSADNED